MPKVALFAVAVIFALVSALHWLRYYLGTEIIIGDTVFPISGSLTLGSVAAFLAAWMILARQDEMTGQAVPQSKDGFWGHRRPRYLSSGLTECGVCGGGVTNLNAERIGDATARNKGTCDRLVSSRRASSKESAWPVILGEA